MKKYRIRITESDNETRFYPEAYQSFFSGWYGWHGNTFHSTRYFDTEQGAREFIQNIKDRTIKETKYIKL